MQDRAIQIDTTEAVLLPLWLDFSKFEIESPTTLKAKATGFDRPQKFT